MTSSALKNSLLPPGLISNLQDVLSSRKSAAGDESKPDKVEEDLIHSENGTGDDDNASKPIIVVTNSDGIDSPGLSHLVDALVAECHYNVQVLAPQSDKSTSGHSVSLKETVEVATTEVQGAVAYEISGTPVDCVSLALSGALFSWSRPLLVVSGIHKGSSCGHHTFYSSVVAGAREALINGVPSLSVSLDWKKDKSAESDFKDAVTVCLPIIKAIIKDIEEGVFPKGLSLDVGVPNSPLQNKGFKVTKRSLWRSTLSWLAVSGSRNQTAARFAGQSPIGLSLAQLSRDASAAGAARRFTTQKKNVEVVESVGSAGKPDFKRVIKYFRAEMNDKEHKDNDENLDFRALENGYVSITPLSPSIHLDTVTENAAVDWISSALLAGQ